MMSIETLLAERRRAARKSLENGTLPAVFSGDVTPEVCPIPFIGDRRPRGWKLINREDLVVPNNVPKSLVYDSICDAPYLEISLFGEDHAVLGERQLLDLIEANPGYGWALVEVGQFQGVLGVFRPPKEADHAS